MIYCELVDTEGGVVYSNIPNGDSRFKGFSENPEKNLLEAGWKQIYREFDTGTVRLISQKDDEVLATTRISSRTARVYADLIPVLRSLKGSQETQYSILSHNLVTTHSRLQDEIESIISEEKLAKARTYSEQISYAEAEVRRDIPGTAKSVFEIARRIVDLKAQIDGFKILSGEIEPDPFPQNIKDILFNICYPYFEDFSQKGVEIRIHIPDEDAAARLVRIDYTIFNIAMHHFLNNALKYTLKDTNVHVRYHAGTSELDFEMMSLRIDNGEIQRISGLGERGANAKTFEGDGIGLYMIQKSLELLKTRMEIVPDHNESKLGDDNNLYEKNRFYIKF